jgi:hypothetical protein
MNIPMRPVTPSRRQEKILVLTMSAIVATVNLRDTLNWRKNKKIAARLTPA